MSYLLFYPVLHNWYNKGRTMCYPVCGMVLIGNSSPGSGVSEFLLLLSEWSFTNSYCRRYITINKMC